MPSLRHASGFLDLVGPLALALLLSPLGCAAEQVPLTQTLPEFHAGAHRLGLVGMFRRGRLDQETWVALAPHLMQPYGGAKCQSAYGHTLREADPDTYAAFDRHIKEEGLDNAALAMLVPYTRADLLLIFDARDPRGGVVTTERKDPTDLPGRPTRSGHARSASATSEPAKAALSAGAGFTLSASLFSVSARKLVARADSRDEKTLRAAAQELSNTLAPMLAGSSCTPWIWPSLEPRSVAPAVASPEGQGAPPAGKSPEGSAAGAPGE
jgi:hypothetical protein